MAVYITDIASFLPNRPVENDEIEGILGEISGLSSRTRRLILRSNRIKSRHYAIDPETGESTHTNAAMTAEAVRKLSPNNDYSLKDLECLCCGTGTPDQLLPGHGSMVHGELGSPPCEVVSAAGVCLSGMAALKYAYMNVGMGLSRNAVATGSEHTAQFIHARAFKPERLDHQNELSKKPYLAFEADFLRWMLSDGAGALLLEPNPVQNELSLRIDWIEHLSFANELGPCMYAGAVKEKDGRLKGWRSFGNAELAAAANSFAIKQDVKLLNRHIVDVCVDRAFPYIADKHRLTVDEVDWFLPHYSSDFFRQKLYDHYKAIGFEIPFERWFTNLETRGNTGSASIFIILEELFHSGKITPGQRLLCFVPESGRFSVCYMGLTAV